MSKKLSKSEFVKRVGIWLIEKWQENYEKNGFKGLGLVYSGIWSAIKVKAKDVGFKEASEIIEKLNEFLTEKGYKIVGDQKAKLKLVRLTKSETVKQELLNELDEILS